MFIISEIGNTHFGSVDRAKEMIKISKECGADAAKFQAFEAKDVAQYGSMPVEFYDLVALTIEEYLELLDFGDSIKFPVFFSIFSKSMIPLWEVSEYKKISAKQSTHVDFTDSIDQETTFASVNPDLGELPKIEHAKIMYASNYLTKSPNLWNIEKLKKHYGRDIGYSDHTIGVETCYEAFCKYNTPYIEKHFTIDRNFRFKGQIFRDCIHSATPDELESLCNIIKRGVIH